MAAQMLRVVAALSNREQNGITATDANGRADDAGRANSFLPIAGRILAGGFESGPRQ